MAPYTKARVSTRTAVARSLPGHFAAPRARSTVRGSASAGAFIAAPGDVAVRPHQHELAFIKRRDLGLRQGDVAQRHVPRLGGFDQSRAVGWLGAEPQQHEAVAEEVDRRAPVREPGVRRARAGAGCRNELLRVDTRLRRRRTVRCADRRLLVAGTAPSGVRGPTEPGWIRPASPVVGSPHVPAGNRGDGIERTRRELDVAHRDRPPLPPLVSQGRARPSHPAWPRHSFQPRLTASSSPVCIPMPPVGEHSCAASPAMKMRPWP